MEVVNKMNFKVKKEEIFSYIQTVQNIISNKTTLPILSNILIETNKNFLKITATDLDMGISCEIPVETIVEGAITIPAKRFNDIIREMPSGEINIYSQKNNQIDIEGKNCRFKLNGLPKDEFPKFPEFKDSAIIQIEQGVLKEMLRLTSFAVSYEESRYVLNGILFEIQGDTLKIIATDGRRLAKIKKKISTVVKEDISVVIPIKAIHEISRNLKNEGTVSFSIGVNQVLFDVNGVLIVTRIIEGEFPNYNQVIPEKNSKKIKINTKDFLSAIRRANLLATPDFQVIIFEIFKNKIVISKKTPDIGESREEVFVEYEGDELVIGFNPYLFVDFLKNINDEFINMEVFNAEKPAVIRLEDYLYLALPMKI